MVVSRAARPRGPEATTFASASVLAAVVLALAVAGAACGGGRDALTIYSGRTKNLIGPLLDRFYADTGIPIDVKYGDSAELALLLSEEGARSPADVFLSQSPGATGYLRSRDLLATLPADALQAVDRRFASATGTWVGVTVRQRVLVYNADLVAADELPATFADLATPAFAGRVAVAPSNGSFQDFVSALRLVEGDEQAAEWLRTLASGGAPTYANNNAIVEAVGRGEVQMGLVNHYYNERFLDEDPSLPSRNHRFADGDVGGLLIPSTVSVLAASTDDRAGRLLEYLLSADAQTYFAQETFEYPLAAGVAPPADLPALDELEAPGVDIDRLGDELTATVDLIRDSGLETG